MSNLNGKSGSARVVTPTWSQPSRWLRCGSLRKTSRDKLPNLAMLERDDAQGRGWDSRNPGISSNVAMPLSARSSSGFWISRASSRTFFAFDIFPAGIHDTGAVWFIARAIAVQHVGKERPTSCRVERTRETPHVNHAGSTPRLTLFSVVLTDGARSLPCSSDGDSCTFRTRFWSYCKIPSRNVCILKMKFKSDEIRPPFVYGDH